LQPSPRNLDGSEGGDATDITYLSFGPDSDGTEDDAVDIEHLGVILVSYQDGKVDLFLDVEKVEARWETAQVSPCPSSLKSLASINFFQDSSRELPVLAVYETIDLGIVTALAQLSVDEKSEPLLDLLHGNHPVFLLDPLHDDMVYIYHAFGVHALDIGPVLRTLTIALESEDQSLLQKGLEKAVMTNVQPILSTFSVERKLVVFLCPCYD
jgi:nucleoporin NUP82